MDRRHNTTLIDDIELDAIDLAGSSMVGELARTNRTV
jgi:hypothetical protein